MMVLVVDGSLDPIRRARRKSLDEQAAGQNQAPSPQGKNIPKPLGINVIPKIYAL